MKGIAFFRSTKELHDDLRGWVSVRVKVYGNDSEVVYPKLYPKI